MSYLAINFSRKLEKVVEQHSGASEACDMTSTPGYDNDGCIGPELVDNGVSLGFACRDYSPKARIFYAVAHETCFYQYGLDEADAGPYGGRTGGRSNPRLLAILHDDQFQPGMLPPDLRQQLEMSFAFASISCP
ncbi:MAG: hypothetical protein GXX96_37630 [Planctomycetaceae bacterium]|nr:hypothetical protein [Planctomycetaceae bacterium]